MHISHVRSNTVSAFKPIFTDITLQWFVHLVYTFNMAQERGITLKYLSAMFAYRVLNDAMHIFQMSVQIENQLQIWTMGTLNAFVSGYLVCD